MSVDIRPELKRYILIGINFKYEGMISHSFDRFYVVTKSILTPIENVKFLPINFGSECNYLKVNLDKHENPVYLTNIRFFFMKIVSLVHFYKKLIDSYNKTVHDVLTKEIPFTLPNFQKNKMEKRGIIDSLVTGFIRLACKGMSTYLNNKRQTA